MPQVASDPKIQVHNHSLPRNARPTQHSDRGPSPFESLLDDGAQAPDQSPAPPPDDKPAHADNAQSARPSPRNDNGKVKAANDTAATKADGAGAVEKADNGNESLTDGKVAAKANPEVSAADDIITPTNEDKPAEGQKADNQPAAPTADELKTAVITVDAVALTTATATASDQDEHVVQLPEQAAPAAKVATQSKPVDLALLKTVVGKQGDAGKPADAGKDAEQVDAGDVVSDETADSPKVKAKTASQQHIDDRPKPTTSESDKQHIAQARGEVPANSRNPNVDAPATFATDTNAVVAKSTSDIAAQVNASSQLHATSNTATSASLVSQPGAAAIPLSGVAIEIAGKALAGKNRFEIRLDPPELGRIEVQLDVDRDGNVTSRLMVDRADTLDLLRRDAAGLERALQDAGLKTANNGLQFSLRDQSMNQQEASGGGNAAEMVVSDDTSVDATPLHYGRHAWQGNGLDIRV